MKKNIRFLLLILFALSIQQTSAQKKEIKSNKDLPALSFSTELLQPDDEASVDAWIKNAATIELPHIDSILGNYEVTNPGLHLALILTKQSCNLILGHWKNLNNPTIASQLPPSIPGYEREGVLIGFRSYAEVMSKSSPDFSKNYIPALKEALSLFDNKDKIKIASIALQYSSLTSHQFKGRIKKIKEKTVASGIPLLWSIITYAFKKSEEQTSGLLSSYTNKLISESFTRADTLRGAINAERAWWNVLRYDIAIKPDYNRKTLLGSNNIQYKVLNNHHPSAMQIDLQEPLIIDSIFFNSKIKLQYTKDGNTWHVTVPKQEEGSVNNVSVYYHGKVHEAILPPWDGGFVWAKDSLGNPWIGVACQGKGASVWYPCKDHQSDEPDNGASLSMIVPDTLVAVGNGRLISKQNNHDGTETYKWAVVNPINNYDISAYIGKYINFGEVYKGENGNLDVNYWVLNYNLPKAKSHMVPEVHRMLKAFEYWFGPYPFYEDGYKIVDAPYQGMEHQSAIAYGNGYKNGRLGQDVTGTGWGTKWDKTLVHESGHEWFGNNITSKDIADMWVHEGFTTYSEVLFTEYWYGKEAGDEYNHGLRNNIKNIFPVIGYYGVNDDISGRNGDMYPKGANLLHTIRHSMDNDSLFRKILRGLNKTFYHQTVTSKQIENYISSQSGYDYSRVFDQYLRNTEIPKLEFYFSPDKKKVFYRYTNCIKGFDLPLVLQNDKAKIRIVPSEIWNSKTINNEETFLFNPKAIEKMYYIGVKEVEK